MIFELIEESAPGRRMIDAVLQNATDVDGKRNVVHQLALEQPLAVVDARAGKMLAGIREPDVAALCLAGVDVEGETGGGLEMRREILRDRPEHFIADYDARCRGQLKRIILRRDLLRPGDDRLGEDIQ